MELARVLGNVVATVKHHSLEGFKLLVIQPVDHEDEPTQPPLVAVDPLQAGPGDLVSWICGREAALAMPSDLSPIDAAIVQIVDQVDARSAPEGAGVPWLKESSA